ncbi:auxilin-like protein 1 [Quillaja saponaria]|uniref:Auxilin-like protein 1 n=1 Tax=Quillaja saponaria TaxID=32244 RepID=A0AAD7PRY7_QUISA|nr:auxilin-like protein 1 [Quillaja saponaria]
MEYGASTATLSKKLSIVYGFSGKSAYDGVFAAPTKFKATSFSSRVDDYCEIFGVSRGSSIPILEVPELNERKFSDDIRPTKLDYSKVFRGFENLDTAISYEELFAEPKREDSSLQEEWSPAKRGISNSGKNLSCIAESPVVSHEASYQSFDGAKIISVLSQGGKNGSNGMTHIAQIHAVSGYTCLFDEITPLKNDADKTLPSVVANTYPCNSVKERLKESRHCTTAVTSPPPDDASKQSSEDRVEVQNRSHRRRSDSVHLSDASDISHGSHYMNMFSSENPACYSDNLKEDSERSMETNGKVSNRNASELPGGDYSLPSFDDLVDSNSEVAASVAALRKAIEEAQERLKVAKESMKRKKEGFRDHVKLRFDYDSKSPREKEGKMAYKGNRKKETKTQEIFEEVDVSGQVPTGIGNEMMRPDQVTSDLGVKEIRFDAKEAVGETQKESEVEETEEEVEWEEVNQYIDDVNTSNYKVTRLEFAQARMLYNVDNNVCNGEKMYSKAFDKSEECDETLTVEPWGQENEKRVYAGKGACGGEEILEEIKSVQEVLAYEGKEERLTVLKNQEETEKKFEASPELEDCERRLNEFQEPKENEKEIAHDQGKIEKKFEVSSKQEECERYLRVHYEPVEDEKEVAPELNQIEGKVEVSCDLKECELRKYQEPIGNEKTFQPQDLDLKNIERQIDNQAWVEHDKIGQEACEENGEGTKSCQ